MDGFRAGIIGVGDMGMAMAKAIVKELPLTAFDLSRKALDEIGALGANIAGSPREVGTVSDAVITMVNNIEQTEAVLFGENGAVEGLGPGKTVIISSSIGPDYPREAYARLKPRGIDVVDCAISDATGPMHARIGELTLMIGGDAAAVEKCRPVFDAMGKQEHTFYLGEIGTGQTYKLINNLATHNLGVLNREILNLGLAAGLDLDRMIEVMGASTGGSWILWYMGATMRARREAVARGEPVKVPQSNGPRKPGEKPPLALEKRLVMEMARKLGVPTPIGDFIDGQVDPAAYTYLADRMARND
jgi:L-serine 3-dehydrogenase (NAD+)